MQSGALVAYAACRKLKPNEAFRRAADDVPADRVTVIQARRRGAVCGSAAGAAPWLSAAPGRRRGCAVRCNCLAVRVVV